MLDFWLGCDYSVFMDNKKDFNVVNLYFVVKTLFAITTKNTHTLEEIRFLYYRKYKEVSEDVFSLENFRKVCKQLETDTKEKFLFIDGKIYKMSLNLANSSTLKNKNQSNTEKLNTKNDLFYFLQNYTDVNSKTFIPRVELINAYQSIFGETSSKLFSADNIKNVCKKLTKTTNKVYSFPTGDFIKITEKSKLQESVTDLTQNTNFVVAKTSPQKKQTQSIKKCNLYYNLLSTKQEKEICNIIKLISKNYQIGSYSITAFKKWFPKTWNNKDFVASLINALELLTDSTDKIFQFQAGLNQFSIKQKDSFTKTKFEEIRKNKVFENNRIFYNLEITLYVYASLNNIICIKSNNHNHKSITISTQNRQGEYVSFNVFYCSTCNKYFTTIDVVENTFPTLNFPMVKLNMSTHQHDSYRMEESELTLYGYNVRADGLSENERRTLLSQLLIMKILSKERIVAILRNNINYNGRKKNLQAAVQKWKDDIDFVQNFDLHKQQKVYSNKIDMIYKGKSLK